MERKGLKILYAVFFSSKRQNAMFAKHNTSILALDRQKTKLKDTFLKFKQGVCILLLSQFSN